MRLFIGIALAPAAASALRQVRERFENPAGDLRWSQPESWHVTLQFLGTATAGQFACVTTSLEEIRAASVPVEIAGLGFFPRAGVFHAGVTLTPELLALHQHVLAATRPCGFLPEARAYHPHITLARSKGRTGSPALKPLQHAVDHARLSLATNFVAEEFLLYESIPSPEGSRYEVRARFPLQP
jgi:2'-5' RNA ligase